eukprot:m.334254 g.334254  ORF g.334254 m.334254 type:complete len:297 (-) comp17319_c0_seq1:38-928(-)
MEVPYIGSQISLISLAEIRYEGTLYNVDIEKATVALSDVRSYGTEDRTVETFVPPSTEVYKYIIFRGKDIKDLNVRETKPAAAPPPDPAIVSTEGPIAPPPGLEKPAEPAYTSPEPKQPRQQQHHQQQQQHQHHHHEGRNQRRNQQRNRTPAVDAPKIEGEFDFEAANAKLDKEKIEEEFLEKKMSEVGLEGEEGEAEEDSNFYDQKSSFFDSISCESAGSRNPRKSRREEKMENSMTFGSVSVDRQEYSSRGRGRGYRGRGRGRGRGRNQGFRDYNYRGYGGRGSQSQNWRNNNN